MMAHEEELDSWYPRDSPNGGLGVVEFGLLNAV